MKNLFISFILAVGLLSSGLAQTDQRTRETKIADIVMQLPAGDTETYQRLMAELSGLGDVIADLAPRLADPGGTDAQIRSAIGGLTMYASQNAEKKAPVAKSLCAAIPKAKSDEIRDFLFIQLQYVAGDESVETAARYLDDARLADAAARVLVRIRTEHAGNALLTALGKATGDRQITLVQSLGDMGHYPAAAAIEALATTDNVKLRKAVLYALAQLGVPSSEKILADAVKNAGYRYEPTDALGSYVKYLHSYYLSRILTSDPGLIYVAKKARTLLKSTSEKAADPAVSSQIAAKIAALHLVALCDPFGADKDILNALKSDCKEYRVAALRTPNYVWEDKFCKSLIKMARKEKRAEVKAEIITEFGAFDGKVALPLIYESLNDANAAVRSAAIVAAAKLDTANAAPKIVSAMNISDAQVIETGKNTLLAIPGNVVTEEVAKALPQTSSGAKIAFMEIIAIRRDTTKPGIIIAQASSTDAPVRLAACEALAAVVTEKDIPRVAELLNAASGKEEIAALQRAMFAAVQGLPQAEQFELVRQQAAKSNNRSAYFGVLAMIGGQDALDLTMSHIINTASDKDKKAAYQALLNWSDDLATPRLYELASAAPSGAGLDEVFSAYINKVARSKNTPEQKLILLGKALDIAKTPAHKQTALQQIARTGTFVGLITAGKYLNDSNNDVQQAAVQTVRTIALAHPGYYGPEVTSLLNKAMAVNKDPETEYQKQAILKHMATLPKDGGFVSMFNGKDLSGWKGLVENPIARSKMTAKQLAEKQKNADETMRRDWKVENGLLVFEGKGYDNLCSEKNYGDFEMYVDWRITKGGDAGIYLRGTPQVQIWDIALTNVGAQVGSGGLYNNRKHPGKPLVVADNPVNEWNSFYIKMIGEKVTVYLNGQLVTENITLENYWDRKLPIFEKDAIELQAHGERVEYRNIYVREIPRPEPYKVSDAEKAEGFVPMFNGIDMSGWIGNLKDYIPRNGTMVCDPSQGGRGNIYTDKEYSDFIMRFEFQLTPAANNGLGIRTPLEGDAAYVGMELQLLDNEADVYKNLEVYQYHGSVYGVIAAKRGYLKPVGEWNTQEVIAQGNRIKITLNGTVILDGDIAEASKNFTQTVDRKRHPGLSNKSGHIGFLGHGSEVAFRNLRIKDLSQSVRMIKKK